MRKETETQLKSKINKLRTELDEIEQKRIAMEQCKYVGKYYKLQNCYSSEENWFEYLKVLRLKDNNNLECLLFYKDTYGIYRIQKNYASMFYSGLKDEWIEITEQEFTIEWIEMLAEINSYYELINYD